MKNESLRLVADLDEYRNTVWAITPESLPVIAAQATVRLDATDLQAAPASSPPSRRGGVAVISMQGTITPGPSLLGMLLGAGGGLREFRSNLRAAIADDAVESIVLDVNSPGGSTDQLTETAAEIRAARQLKPITAVANNQAGSAAYWLASQANEVVVTPSGEVGSIGVFGVHHDVSAALAKEGVRPTLIAAGKYKTEGNPFEPLSDEARATFQRKADTFYGAFLADVAAGRGVTADAVRDGFGEGRMVTAQAAVVAGMADRVDTIDNVIAQHKQQPPAQPRRTAATELQPALQAAEKESETTPLPTTPTVSEEERARIRALLAQHPIHVQETT